MSDPGLEHRHDLALRFSGALCLVFAAGAALRFVLVDITLINYLSVFNTLLALGLYQLIRSNRLPAWEAPLLMAIGVFAVTPLLLITGGVNSQFIFVLICFPIAAAQLGSLRLPWLICSILILLLCILLVFNEQVIDLTAEIQTGRKTTGRAIWLMAGIAAMTAAGSYFQRTNHRLMLSLDRLATMDHLTGLLNRRGLEMQLDIELQRIQRSGETLCLLLLDIDFFKLFNDRFGHDAGDHCLVEVATKLRENTRSQDLVARYGGEEFVVVLTQADRAQALLIAEELRSKVAAIRLPEIEDRVSVTIGCVCADPAQGLSREELIRLADKSLYRGKQSGRNQVVTEGKLCEA